MPLTHDKSISNIFFIYFTLSITIFIPLSFVSHQPNNTHLCLLLCSRSPSLLLLHFRSRKLHRRWSYFSATKTANQTPLGTLPSLYPSWLTDKKIIQKNNEKQQRGFRSNILPSLSLKSSETEAMRCCCVASPFIDRRPPFFPHRSTVGRKERNNGDTSLLAATTYLLLPISFNHHLAIFEPREAHEVLLPLDARSVNHRQHFDCFNHVSILTSQKSKETQILI